MNLRPYGPEPYALPSALHPECFYYITLFRFCKTKNGSLLLFFYFTSDDRQKKHYYTHNQHDYTVGLRGAEPGDKASPVVSADEFDQESEYAVPGKVKRQRILVVFQAHKEPYKEERRLEKLRRKNLVRVSGEGYAQETVRLDSVATPCEEATDSPERMCD